MSFLAHLFKRKNEEDYETILASLVKNIEERQIRLSEIRLRERRTSLLVTLYTIALWVVYVAFWYLNLLPSFFGDRKRERFERAGKALLVVIGPILTLFVRRTVEIWYQRIRDAEEKTLQVLMKQQRSKLEEIKQKTNYYSTRELLQKYDEASRGQLPQRKRVPQTPSAVPTPQKLPQPHAAVNSPGNTPLKPQVTAPQPFPPTPPRKEWYDRLADALLGDDDAVPTTSRYALICERCLAHNGLVKESMWEDVQYVCPKCNHFNPSPRSRRQVASPRTPSPRSPLPGAEDELKPQHIDVTRSSPSPVNKGISDDPPVVDSAEMEVDTT